MMCERLYKNCEEEEDQRAIVRNNPLQIIESPNGKIIDFYLHEEIYDMSQYIDFLRAVENAKADDRVQVHINCPGGNVDVAWNIFDVLQQSQAQVLAKIEGECASAASMIMLACNEWQVNPHSYVMVHAWSGFRYGKRNEMVAASDFEKRYLEKKFRDMYKDFMTEEEINLCLEGKDYYFDADETLERLQKYQEDAIAKQQAIQAVAAKYQDVMNKEIEEILNGKKAEKKVKKEKKTEKEEE